jgi:GNAT superfamily N-acetyltransferase
MQSMKILRLTFSDADETMRDRVGAEWGEKAARHMHLTEGFSIIALEGEILVGLISVYAKTLPAPLDESFDWYIDILEVSKDYRRRGIASHLIELAIQRAKAAGVYQIRSWSSEDKIEAIPMWRALGFGLCPATTHPQGKEVKGYFVAKVL